MITSELDLVLSIVNNTLNGERARLVWANMRLRKAAK